MRGKVECLNIMIKQLDEINMNLSRLAKQLELTRISLQDKCECKHAKKEEDEVLSIFSDLIDDLDHVTIHIKEI